MRADDGRIDHLQPGVRHSAFREPFQDHVPDATVGPPPKLPKNRVPVAEFLRQIAPRGAGSHQPKHRVEHAAVVAWRPSAAAMDQEWFEVRPLIVGHQSANQFIPLQPSFNWHGLRHFAVSTWIEAGLSPKTVQTFACHASLQVMMDRYGHLFPSEDHKRAMDRIATTLFTGTSSER